ncbi:hypothetical protein NP493_241g05034 [Ridgeia piscesae]|uniref:Uncharacterized protein n=1 Tax=Ridgeia piscesae TaxID=27915 RepID=A0AAD9UDG6_RIDPI|nr:hypothetical protein NP493_241g05034 [Ridgeia piscesae]
MCLLHPTLASFSSWPRIIGVAAPYTESDNTSRSSSTIRSHYTCTIAYLYTDYIADLGTN